MIYYLLIFQITIHILFFVHVVFYSVDFFLDFLLRSDILSVREILSARDIVACSNAVGEWGNKLGEFSDTGVRIENARLMGDITGNWGRTGTPPIPGV